MLKDKFASFCKYKFVFLIGCVVGLGLGIGGTLQLYRPVAPQPITITKKEFVPQVIEKQLKVPAYVAEELIAVAQETRETDKSVVDSDRVIDFVIKPDEEDATQEIKQYNVVLDRPKEIGLVQVDDGVGLLYGQAINKDISVKVIVSLDECGKPVVKFGLTKRMK